MPRRLTTSLRVVGDQGALVWLAEFPVPPDPGGQGEQPLGDPDVHTGQGAPAMLLQRQLAFEGVEQALDPLANPTQRPLAAGFSLAVRAQQPRAILAHQLLELPTSEALVADQQQPGSQPGALLVQQ